MYKNRNRKYSGFTLIELLVVMSILMILGGLTFASFNNLQKVIKLNEYANNLEQNVRNAQRASMLLERGSSEKWLYGIGVDFSLIDQAGSNGIYRVFKWCSPFDDYGNGKTSSRIPAYNPAVAGGITSSNGYLNPFPKDSDYATNTCYQTQTDTTAQIRGLSGYTMSVKPPISTITTNAVRYVLFEAVTGRTFFYNETGALINYTGDGKLVSNPIDFELTITPLAGGVGKHIKIQNISGRVSIEANK